MASPKKTLLVEQISYAEEALRNLREQLHKLLEHFEYEYQRVAEELKNIEKREVEVDEETFERVNRLLQDAWIKAMSARNYLQDLDKDFSDCDAIMASVIIKLKNRGLAPN